MNSKIKGISLASLTIGGAIVGVLKITNSQDNINKANFSEKEENISPITPNSEEDEKAKIRERAKKAFSKMNDYSFRLFSPCGLGTGWVLDYLIPENGKYPTTWYIATNAHVVEKYRFKDNKYEVELPISDTETAQLQYKWKPNKPRGVQINNEKLWEYSACQAVDWYGYFDMNMAKQSNGEKLNAEKGAIASGKMKEPKLFYAAIDFLDENEEMNVSKHNYKDFAVLEIEFTDEDYAKEVTDNFAGKYPIETTEAINIFEKPLIGKHSQEEIGKINKNFYSLAYPIQEGKPFDYQINWNDETAEASTLSLDPYNFYHHSGEEKLNGHVNANRMGTTMWNGIKRKNVGHYYFVKGFPMVGGSSGGLYIDGDGNLLGIKSAVEAGTTTSIHNFIEPLRSNKIITSAFKTPAYDLIVGGIEGQKTSYKQQVEKFHKNTFLSNRGWKHKS